MVISDTQLAALLLGLGVPRDRVMPNVEYLMEALPLYEINTPLRLGHFLSQVLHESVALAYFEEIASGAAYEGRVDLGNVIPGDGRKYKGRGPIQLTGRYNYTEFQKWLVENGYEVNVVTHPELVATFKYGWLAALWYYTLGKKSNGRATDLNLYADRGDTLDVIREITKLINGGYNGLADRKGYFMKAMRLIRAMPGFMDDGGVIGYGTAPVVVVPPALAPIPVLPPAELEAGECFKPKKKKGIMAFLSSLSKK